MMAAEATTQPTDGVTAFLATVTPPERQAEAVRLLTVFADTTGYPARLWGSMIGFGRYSYTYASGHSGESLATGFAPRKAEMVIYGLQNLGEDAPLLADLGPHRRGKACVYLKRLDRVDLTVLARLIRAGLDDLARQWPIHPV